MLYQDLEKLKSQAPSNSANDIVGYRAYTGKQSSLDTDQPWSKDLVEYLGISVLVFGIIAMVLMFILFMRNRTTDLVLRAFGIPLIIISAVFLIVAGYTENQIAPVMGLLGTIAGYLLAKNDSNKNSQPPNPQPPAAIT